ncbi:MAG TPA: tetratricopeptide repeat protein [Terriglobia bacterium]|jgi:Tfp pilus assembly protein PilF
MLGKILLVFVLAQGAGTQRLGAIRGQIIIPTAHASDRILVELQKADGPPAGQTYSDTLGHYEFGALVPGSYILLVHVDGYEDIRQEVGVGSGTFGAQVVNIQLRETETLISVKPTVAADQVIDVNELGRNYPRKAIQDYEKSREAIRKGNNAGAIEILSGVLKIAPDFYSAHNTLGTLYQKTGRFTEAEDEYRRARELNPRSPDPLVNIGSLYIDEAALYTADRETAGKILDNALDILEDALKMKRSAPAYYFLGSANYRSSFYEEAEEDFKRSLALDSHMGASQLMLANVYIKQQKWQDALEHLDAYLNDNPSVSDRPQIEATRSKVAEKAK